MVDKIKEYDNYCKILKNENLTDSKVVETLNHYHTLFKAFSSYDKKFKKYINNHNLVTLPKQKINSSIKKEHLLVLKDVLSELENIEILIFEKSYKVIHLEKTAINEAVKQSIQNQNILNANEEYLLNEIKTFYIKTSFLYDLVSKNDFHGYYLPDYINNQGKIIIKKEHNIKDLLCVFQGTVGLLNLLLTENKELENRVHYNKMVINYFNNECFDFFKKKLIFLKHQFNMYELETNINFINESIDTKLVLNDVLGGDNALHKIEKIKSYIYGLSGQLMSDLTQTEKHDLLKSNLYNEIGEVVDFISSSTSIRKFQKIINNRFNRI